MTLDDLLMRPEKCAIDCKLMLEVGRCRMTVSKPVLKASMCLCLQLALEATISCTTFNCCFQFQLAAMHYGGAPRLQRRGSHSCGRWQGSPRQQMRPKPK